jgi:hypothetical protein
VTWGSQRRRGIGSHNYMTAHWVGAVHQIPRSELVSSVDHVLVLRICESAPQQCVSNAPLPMSFPGISGRLLYTVHAVPFQLPHIPAAAISSRNHGRQFPCTSGEARLCVPTRKSAFREPWASPFYSRIGRSWIQLRHTGEDNPARYPAEPGG